MKWYVYDLIDPRDDSAFYVGKGCGDRMRHHFRKGASENVKRELKAIALAGHTAFPRQVAFFYDEREALLFEAERIRELTPVANVKHGRSFAIKRPERYSLIGTVCDLLCGAMDTWKGAQRLHMFGRVQGLERGHIQLIELGLEFCDRRNRGLV